MGLREMTQKLKGCLNLVYVNLVYALTTTQCRGLLSYSAWSKGHSQLLSTDKQRPSKTDSNEDESCFIDKSQGVCLMRIAVVGRGVLGTSCRLSPPSPLGRRGGLFESALDTCKMAFTKVHWCI